MSSEGRLLSTYRNPNCSRVPKSALDATFWLAIILDSSTCLRSEDTRLVKVAARESKRCGILSG